MEADYGSDMPIKLVVPWKNDWEQFKRMFKASARLNGVADAIKAGEKIAKMRVSRFSHWIVYTRLFPTADRYTRDSRCSDPTIGFVSQFYRPLLPGLRRVILYLVIQASATSSIYSIELSTNYGTF